MPRFEGVGLDATSQWKECQIDLLAMVVVGGVREHLSAYEILKVGPEECRQKPG